MKLKIHSMWHGACPLLGKSFFIWVQGCPRRCPGCFNEAALPFSGAALECSAKDLLATWQPCTEGLILSGGEPFSQAEGLALLCRLARTRHSATLILAYTGYYMDQLLTGKIPGCLDLLKQIDVLVDGPYLQERRTDFPLAGSDNQRIILLSQRIPSNRLVQLQRPEIRATLSADGALRLVGTGSRQVDMHDVVKELSQIGIFLDSI